MKKAETALKMLIPVKMIIVIDNEHKTIVNVPATM